MDSNDCVIEVKEPTVEPTVQPTVEPVVDVQLTRSRSDSDFIARRAIQLALGTDNDYLHRLLTNYLDGKPKKKKIIPISSVINSDMNALKNTLSMSLVESQRKAVNILSNSSPLLLEAPQLKSQSQPLSQSIPIDFSKLSQFFSSFQSDIDSQVASPELCQLFQLFQSSQESQSTLEKTQSVNKWIMDSVLQEKLKDRETRVNSDYWKYINGGLAVILPLVTGLAQYFIKKYTSGCN
jgi:hypothetical protein